MFSNYYKILNALEVDEELNEDLIDRSYEAQISRLKIHNVKEYSDVNVLKISDTYVEFGNRIISFFKIYKWVVSENIFAIQYKFGSIDECTEIALFHGSLADIFETEQYLRKKICNMMKELEIVESVHDANTYILENNVF